MANSNNLFSRLKASANGLTEILKQPLTNTSTMYLALTATVISIILASMKYVDKGYLWDSTYTMQASLLSTLASAAVVLPFFLRSISNKIEHINGFHVLIILLNIWMCATFIGIFFSGKAWKIPLIDMNSRAFLLMCILMSWVGMRIFAGIMWIVLFFIGIIHAAGLDQAMGFYGVIYILCVSASIILQFKQFYADGIITSINTDFFGVARQHLQQDIGAATGAATNLITGINLKKNDESCSTQQNQNKAPVQQ